MKNHSDDRTVPPPFPWWGRQTTPNERTSLLLADSLARESLFSGQQLGPKELAERVGRAVAQLTEEDQTLLRLRFAEGLSYVEIARLLKAEPATVRMNYGKVLIRLQGILTEHGLLG